MSLEDDNIPEALQEFLNQQQTSLEPLAPSEGVKRFLRSQADVAESTLDQHRRKLGFFTEYCDSVGLENLNELDGRKIEGFRTWRREESSDRVDQISRVTMRDDMYLLQKFLRYLERIEAVEAGLAGKVQVPTVPDGADSRDVELDPERVEKILDYLEKYQYASREHVVLLLHCRVGRRPCGLYALDCEDVHLNTQQPYLEFVHRPGETSLKNGSKSEAQVNISEDVAEVLQDYYENRRTEVTCDYGRRPFLSSIHGRLSKSTMQRYFYQWTRPCAISDGCPHDKSPDECLAAQSPHDHASKCPSSHSPYSSRHGYFTEMRRRGVPVALLSERADVSEEILSKHYDERTDEEKRGLRREVLDEFREDDDGGYLA